MNKEFVELLTKHMMRSVNDRYAILKRLGFEERLLGLLTLEGPAVTTAFNVASTTENWFNKEQIQGYCEVLKSFDLPEWMNKAKT